MSPSLWRENFAFLFPSQMNIMKTILQISFSTNLEHEISKI